MMYATLFRETPVAERPGDSAKGTWSGFLGRLLEAMVQAESKRLPSRERELPREWFQYPLF